MCSIRKRILKEPNDAPLDARKVVAMCSIRKRMLENHPSKYYETGGQYLTHRVRQWPKHIRCQFKMAPVTTTASSEQRST